MGSIKKSKLPEGYQECEWIGNGQGVAQYIDTSIKTTNKTKIELEASYINSASASIFGSYNMGIQTSGTNFYLNYNGENSGAISTVIPTNKKIKLTIDNNKFYLDDSLIYTFTSGVFTSSYTSLLNAYRTASGGVGTSCTGEKHIYGLKIYESGFLVQNLIPCLDENGIPCFYDLVNKKGYYNEGEGELLYSLKEPTLNLAKETKLGFPASNSTSISVNSTYPYTYYFNDIFMEQGKTYKIKLHYVREPNSTDDGTIRIRLLNENGTIWGAPSASNYTSYFDNVELKGKVGSSAIADWYTSSEYTVIAKKNCYARILIILGTKAKTPPCVYMVETKEV
jgi:hypothetical protein